MIVTVYGKEYEVKHIGYKEVLDFAKELANEIIVCDDKNGVVYERYDADAIKTYLFVKYFTDYPITGEEDTQWKYDLVNSFEAQDNDVDWIIPSYVHNAYNAIYEAIEKRFTAQHSLSRSVLGVFQSILGDEDITKTIAESRTVSENLLDLMRKAKLFDENERDKKQKSKIQEKDFLKIFGKKDV